MTHKSIPIKNKSILLIIIILLLSKSNVFGQNLAIKFEADSTLQKGDTALIKIKDEIRGTIQWQQSYEKENWEDIAGETSTELLREINDTTFFRVKITEESCELPFYSDVVKINTMKVSPKTVIIDTNKTYLVSDTQELENDIYKYLGDTDFEVTENSVLVGYKYNGYVKIVDAISYLGDTLVLNTHSGRISDIFEYYNVEDSVHLLLSDEDVKKSGTKGKIIKGKTVYQKQGVSLKKEGSGLNLSDVVLFDGTVENVDLQIIITNGEVNFKPAFSSYFDIKLLSVNYIRLIAEGALDMNMDVSVNASSSIEFGDEINLFSISYPFAIGPVPVNIKVSFNAGFISDLTVSGTFSTGFETTQNLAFGASYDKNTNPNWEAIWNRNGTFNEHPLEMSNESGEVNAKFYVKPAISFNVGWDPFSKKSEENEDSEEIDSTNKYLTQDSIAVKTEKAEKLFEFGPYLAVSPYLRYNSIIDFNGWEYGIYGGAEGELGFNVSFFGYNIADFNTTLASWEKDIITGTSSVADFSSDSTDISPGSPVQFTDESTGEPESWYWDFGDGETSTEQNPSHVYENVGNYDVSLTVEGSYGSNTETKTDYITVESGGNGGTEVVEVTNPATGKIWMDRNLGAAQVATSSTDANAYGDLYQWGRGTDGHEKPNSSTTSTLSTTDNPGHGDFITVGSDSDYDWRSPQNDDLWQGINGTNNPCPDGYRLPTEAEWEAERSSWISNDAAGAFASPLKLPMAGYRGYSSGGVGDLGFLGNYWSSTVVGARSWLLYFTTNVAGIDEDFRAYGTSVRCLKDATNTTTATVTTTVITDIAQTTASGGGNATDDGGAEITARGVVYSTSETPTVETNQGITTDGTGTGEYTSSLTGLTVETTYYVRAYATNSEGTAYGGQESFTTLAEGGGDETEVVEVTNPATGKIWMDRNLGASQVATSSTDAASYGDLYQWGRAADGHESRTSGTTATLSTTDKPGHGDFITSGSSPYDWRSPQNDNLWQGVSGTNNPCPGGYRLPTEAEWEAELQSWSSNDAAGAFGSPLKLPVAGLRDNFDGSLGDVGSNGYYWSGAVAGTYSRGLYFFSSFNTYAYVGGDYRAYGNSVRCLKD